MNPGLPSAAVLMCHAPIVIPPIGGTRAGDCTASTQAMREAARAVVESGAETVALLSPHLPRHRQAFGVVASERIRGDFANFGQPEIACSFRGDAAAGAAITRAALRAGLEIEPVETRSLDHGATVPLWFLQEAGFKGRLAVFGFPWYTDGAANRRFGAALREAMEGLERRWALVASGDMSHALKPGAPSGFHPRAQEFDRAVVERVAQGMIGAISTLPIELRDLAAEDVVDSLEVVAGVLGEEMPETRTLSYEGPFGVGYLIAELKGNPA